MKRNEELKKIRSTAAADASTVLAEDTEAKQKDKMTELFSDYLTQIASAKEGEDGAVAANAQLAEQIESLKARNKELEEEIASQRKELDDLKSSMDKEKADLEKQLDTVTKEADSLKAKLEEAKKEATFSKRVKDLEEAGLLMSGKSKDRQLAKVKKMGAEDFKDYVAELIDMKEEWASREVASEDNLEEAEVNEEEYEEDDDLDTNLSLAQLIKLRRAEAALGVSRKRGTEYDNFGVRKDLKNKYEQIWD